jgi:hypothetical protein
MTHHQYNLDSPAADLVPLQPRQAGEGFEDASVRQHPYVPTSVRQSAPWVTVQGGKARAA